MPKRFESKTKEPTIRTSEPEKPSSLYLAFLFFSALVPGLILSRNTYENPQMKPFTVKNWVINDGLMLAGTLALLNYTNAFTALGWVLSSIYTRLALHYAIKREEKLGKPLTFGEPDALERGCRKAITIGWAILGVGFISGAFFSTIREACSYAAGYTGIVIALASNLPSVKSLLNGTAENGKDIKTPTTRRELITNLAPWFLWAAGTLINSIYEFCSAAPFLQIGFSAGMFILNAPLTIAFTIANQRVLKKANSSILSLLINGKLDPDKKPQTIYSLMDRLEGKIENLGHDILSLAFISSFFIGAAILETEKQLKRVFNHIGACISWLFGSSTSDPRHQ